MFRLLTSPRMIGVHLLVLVATAAATWLGLWQYGAWQSSRDTQAMDRAGAEPKALSAVMSPDDPYPGDAIGQPVHFEGRWIGGETFLVSDREVDGRTGYWVVTPVVVSTPRQARDGSASTTGYAGDEPALLVVRGWVPTTEELPPDPTGEVAVTGWLQPPEGSGRPDPDPSDDVLPEVRIVDVLQRMDMDLYGGYVIAEGVSTGSTTGSTIGLTPVTPDSLPEPAQFTALRNLLYALEWWVFAGFAVFLWWRMCRDEAAQSRLAPTSSTTGDGGSTTGEVAKPTEVASNP